jgi:hypothetical protein
MTADGATGTVSFIYNMENHTPEGVGPRAGHWFHIDELRSRLGPVHELALIESRLCRVETGQFDQEPPWYRRGWLPSAARWISEKLSDVGTVATGPIEQVRTWERSCVLRVPTSDGWVYFKAARDVTGHEPALTAVLSRWFPSHVPEVLALGPERHWMLLRGSGESSLEASRSVVRWEEALSTYADMQVDCCRRIQQLLDLGCPMVPLPTLAVGLDAMCRDESIAPHGLDQDDLKLLEGRATRCLDICLRLAEHNLPLSLEHGDLWPGNIITDTPTAVYLDWSEATISHPFFSVALFLEYAKAMLPAEPDVCHRLAAAYLRPWRTYAKPRELTRAFGIAWKLGPLYRAIVYHERILPGTNAKWEVRPLFLYFVREFLRRTS